MARGMAPTWKDRAVAAKAAVGIVETVRAHLDIVPDGREFKAVCPFHEDHSPSMTIKPEPDGGFYKCFACGAGGDPVQFLQDHAGLDFKAAVEWLEQRSGTAPSREQIEARRHAQERYAERKRADSVRMAREVWAEACVQDAQGRKGRGCIVGTAPAFADGRGFNHPQARAYLEARGVPLARLPGACVPRAVQFHGAVYRNQQAKDERPLPTRLPALVCAFVAGRELTGVQRIFLEPDGSPRKVSGGKAKMHLGSLRASEGGGAVRLCGRPAHDGVLWVCEGVETALAVLAAVHPLGQCAGVWATVGTEVMRALKISREEIVSRAAAEGVAARGAITAVMIAGDLDKGQAGQKAAAEAAEHVRTQLPGVPVGVATPSRAIAPMLVGEDGQPLEGKKADWLDVVNAVDAQRVGEYLNACVQSAACGEHEPAGVAGDAGARGEAGSASGGDGGRSDGGGSEEHGPGGEESDGSGRTVLVEDGRGRAKQFLELRMAPRDEDGAWGVARAAGTWWLWRQTIDPTWKTRLWAWKPENEERINNLLTAWCEHCYVRNRDGKMKPAALGGEAIASLRRGLASIVDPMSDAMPCWLPAAMKSGEPHFADPLAALERAEEMRADVIGYADRLLDLEAWRRGTLRAMPRTSRWFARAVMPYRLPEKILREVLQAGDDADEVVAQACPRWIAFLRTAFDGTASCIRELQKWMGYTLTSSTEHHKILWLQGQSGTGKGVIREVQTMIVGEENVASIEFDSLGGQFGLAPLVGKSLWAISEMRMDGNTHSVALDRLLKLSAGDPVDVNDKYAKALTSVRLGGKFMITPNEAPPIRDSATALMRRLLVIPMLCDSVDEARADRGLVSKLRAEADGIVAWAMVGLRKLHDDGGFVQPKEGLFLKEEMRAAQSPYRVYWEECVQEAEGQEIEVKTLFEDWKRWAEQRGINPGSVMSFGRGVVAAVPRLLRAQSMRGDGDARRKVGVYRGWRLNPERITPQAAWEAPQSGGAYGLSSSPW